MIYDAKIPAKLFATLRTSIGKPRKMFGQWHGSGRAGGKWQVPAPSALPHSTVSSIRSAQHTAAYSLALRPQQAARQPYVFLNKCCG